MRNEELLLRLDKALTDLLIFPATCNLQLFQRNTQNSTLNAQHSTGRTNFVRGQKFSGERLIFRARFAIIYLNEIILFLKVKF